ncbi:MAG: creatininase family protein, partial [Anaerolineaceae bacterium]|nr:creatininase family protein [Anaerolineaceae bacterium]
MTCYSLPNDGRFLPHLTSMEIAEIAKREDAIVLLPVASIEQHGPHLPVYTDSIIAEQVLARTLDRLPKDFPLWYLPLLPYGKSNEHGGIPGTFSFTSETFIKVLKEIALSVAKNGFRRLVILNAHGGNTEIIDFVIRDIRENSSLFVFGLHIFLRIATPTAGLSEDEMTFGIHAGDIETSILLHTHPELVNMELAPDSIPLHLKELQTPPFLGPLNFAWLTGDISRTGVLGNAKTADPQRGKMYLEDAAD